VHWPGVTGRACWDSGAEVTIVSQAFWDSHPELFQQTGTTVGTDATGTQTDTPTLLMREYEIAGRKFVQHHAVAVDLAHANSTMDLPRDFILGYPTLRQADWLFDFPARRWSFTS
jgi:hypothetical protein